MERGCQRVDVAQPGIAHGERFGPPPRRRLIERSVGRLIKNSRLVRDCEQRADVAGTFTRIAASVTMLRRVAERPELGKHALAFERVRPDLRVGM